MKKGDGKIGFWRGRIRSFRYAGRGIKMLFRYEHNAQFHLGAIVVVTIAGLIFKISSLEWCAVFLCFSLVTALECINTAVEKLCDFIHPDFEKKIGAVKDYASGAVLLATLAAVAVGLIVFLPKLISIF